MSAVTDGVSSRGFLAIDGAATSSLAGGDGAAASSLAGGGEAEPAVRFGMFNLAVADIGIVTKLCLRLESG